MLACFVFASPNVMRISPAHLLLVLIAAIWGSGFVAQRAGMEHLGPFSFNAARFVLAFLSLLPVWWFTRRQLAAEHQQIHYDNYFWFSGLLAGSVMFLGFTFQQVGLQYTTAGNAGFITSIYIVLVPILSLWLGQTTGVKTWIGIVFAVVGLYILSVGPNFHINKGDFLELLGSLFWATHVVTLGWAARRVKDLVGLSALQFAVAAILATIAVPFIEQPNWQAYQAAMIPLFYSGLIVSGLSFTLQIFAQRSVNASVAALILSGEAVFALIAGWLFLGETVGAKQLTGCGLMLIGMLISQWPDRKTLRTETA